MNIIKLKARNGQLFSVEKYFKNDNQFEISWNWLRLGLGIKFWLGDMCLSRYIISMAIYIYWDMLDWERRCIRMKAWLVREKDEFCAAVVFAETRGKARSLALSTECCEDVNFTDIEAGRMKQADKYYKDGKWQLDWENPQDRIALVKDCGFTCDYDAFNFGDCELCSAVQYCDQYKTTQNEKGGAE